MPTWKKILTEADAQKDLVAGAGLTGGADNVLVGTDSDVTIAVDINGATDLGSSVASGDLLLVADIDDSNNIKKTSVADIVGAVSSGVTSAKLTGDSGNTGADTGAVNHTIAGGNGIVTAVSGDTLTVTLDISDSSLTTETAIAQADLIAFSDESATNDPTVNITFSNFEDTIFGNVSSDATIAAGGALTIANDAVTNAKLANIAQGSVKVGGGSNAPTDLDASGDGKILVGDGTDINSVSVSGDVALANDGAVTIQANAVEASMLNNNIVSGLTDIGAAIASTDEFIISDAGTIRRSDISRLTTFLQSALTFTTNTDVNVSKANLTTVLASYTGDDTLNIGDSGDDTTVVIRGNLQVDGTTTTVNSTTLTVDDKIITAASGSANAAGAGTAGLEIDTSDSTQLPFVGFVDGAGLTEMVVKAEGNTTAFPIAIMEFSADSTAPSGNAGGVGSFHFDTGDDKLYVRTA